MNLPVPPHASPLAPDLSIIKDHLALLSRPYIQAGLSGKITLRTLPAARHQMFELQDIDAAAEWAHQQNLNHQQNVYVAPGLFAPDSTGAGSDEQVIAHAHLFADADDGDQAARLLDQSHDLHKYQCFRIITGSQPSLRLHAYFGMITPVRDMTLWRESQRALIGELDTDTQVKNPSRIMRLAGTVSYPAPVKAAKGYVPEFVRLEPCDEATPLPSLQSVLKFAKPTPRAVFRPIGQPAGPISSQIAAIQQQESSGTGWYNLMLSLAGTLARQLANDDEVLRVASDITWSGYTVEETYSTLKSCVDQFVQQDRSRQISQHDQTYEQWRDTWYYVAQTKEFVGTAVLLSKEGWIDFNKHLFDQEVGRPGKQLWTSKYLEDPLAHKLKSYCFRPEQPRITHDGFLNDWMPSPAMELASSGDPNGLAANMFEQLVLKLCRGRQEVAEIVMHWIARGLFMQTERVRWGLVFVSSTKGLGKGILCNIISALYGRHLSTNANGLGSIIGRFQANLKGRMFVSVAEAVDRGDNNRFSANEALKPLITEDYLSIEQKHRDPILVENYLRFVFCSNHLDGLQFDRNERRFGVINAADTEPFDANFYAELAGLAETQHGLADIAAYLYERVGEPLPSRSPEIDLMEAVEDLTPEWINDLHDRLDAQRLAHCAMTDEDLKKLKPQGTSDPSASYALKRAGWRRERLTLGGKLRRVWLRGDRNGVAKVTDLCDLFDNYRHISGF